MHSFEQKLFSNCSTICHISLLSRLTARFVKTKPMFYKFILSLELLGKLWGLVMWLSLIKKQADRLSSGLAHAQLMPLNKLHCNLIWEQKQLRMQYSAAARHYKAEIHYITCPYPLYYEDGLQTGRQVALYATLLTSSSSSNGVKEAIVLGRMLKGR